MQAANLFLGSFQKILDAQPELLKKTERMGLENIIANLPNNDELLAEEIVRWCSAHPEIDKALNQLLADSFKDRGIAGQYPSGKAKIEYEKNRKETLLNALRKSSSSEKNSSNMQQKAND